MTKAGRTKLSTVGRTIDIHFTTNRAIALLSLAALLAGLCTSMLRGDPLSAGTVLGLSWGGAAFLSWALARETDPDRWISAFFAAAGALTATLLLGRPSFLLLFWFLITLRFINRSTGEAPGWLDLVGYYGMTLWIGLSIHWIIPLLAFPTILFVGSKRFSPPFPFLLVVMFPVTGLALGHVQQWHVAWLDSATNGIAIGIITGITLATAFVIRSYRVVHSKADRTNASMESRRVQWALGWAIAAAVILTLTETIQDLAPVWAALIGTIFGWLVSTLHRRLIAE